MRKVSWASSYGLEQPKTPKYAAKFAIEHLKPLRRSIIFHPTFPLLNSPPHYWPNFWLTLAFTELLLNLMAEWLAAILSMNALSLPA
jgi:hypothetical protein